MPQTDADSVVTTAELDRRPRRPPQFEAENRALVALARKIANSPGTILQSLADTAMRLCQAGSAGISILDKGCNVFRWQATAGAFGELVGAILPRDFSPCGVVLDRNALQLMTEPARHYPYIADLEPPVHEVLLVPFSVADEPVGTIWIVSHKPDRQFDAEDARLATSLAEFASAAYQTLQNLETSEKFSRELQDIRTRVNVALDAGAIATWSWDVETDQVHGDSALGRIFSLSPEVVKSGPLASYLSAIHPDDQQQVTETMRRSIRSGSTYASEYRTLTPEGLRWVVARGQIERNELGRAVRMSGVVMDVTDRRIAEESARKMANQLREIAADLSEEVRRKDEFLATLAHELRNPLAPLRNSLTVLSLTKNDPAAFEKTREIMERQVQQMVRLIDDLLDISRISQNKLDLRKEQIALSDLIRQTIDICQPAIDEARHQLTVSVPPEPIHLDADLVRLSQVFSNLLNNACKYTEPGGEISLTAEAHGDEILMTVSDTGVGIPAEMLPKIFDLFTQVDRSLERSKGGLGIGLTLVKRLVEMHGGTVQAQSEGKGKGSKFIVRLPMVAEPRRTDGPTGVESNPAGRRILVVDDNQDSAMTLAMLLKLQGHQTETVFDGMAAVEAAARLSPDVILLDIGLPKLNGYEAARQIRKLPSGKEVLLVALTGWGQEDDRRKSHDAGFDHHLVKPIEHATLTKLLNEASAKTAKK